MTAAEAHADKMAQLRAEIAATRAEIAATRAETARLRTARKAIEAQIRKATR